MKTVEIKHPSVYINTGDKVEKLCCGGQVELAAEVADKLIARGVAVLPSDAEAKEQAAEAKRAEALAASEAAKAAKKAKVEEQKAIRAAEDAAKKAAAEAGE